MDYPNSEFWNYSSQIWTLPGTEKVCLELQNKHEINVNILLYCAWAGDKKLCMNDDDLQMLLDTTQPWQTIIKPLRDSRKMMKQSMLAMPSKMVDQTLKNINEMELNAEHMEQLALEKTLNLSSVSPCSSESSVECSLSNFVTYLSSLESISSTEDLMPQLSELLNAIYQDEEAVQLALMNGTAT